MNIFYTVESTGWSGGYSWFEAVRGTRFSEFDDAMKACNVAKKALNQDITSWRVVKHTHIHEENKHTHIEEYTNV